MKTVSFQGTQLTAGQRRTMQMQQQARAFVNPILQQQVNETLAAVDARRSLGTKPERQWFVVINERGTPCVADAFGF